MYKVENIGFWVTALFLAVWCVVNIGGHFQFGHWAKRSGVLVIFLGVWVQVGFSILVWW